MHKRHYKNRHINRLSFFASVHVTQGHDDANSNFRYDHWKALRGIPCLKMGSGQSQPPKKLKEFDNATENLTCTARVQKKETENLTQGPKSYLSAHHDPKKKKEFDNATENLTRAAVRPK